MIKTTRSPNAQPRVTMPAHSRSLLQQLGHMAERLGVSAYAVGGCVRDWILGITQSSDLDVVVEGEGIKLAQTVAEALEAPLQVHPQFGTATITLSSRGVTRRVDIATARKETYAKPAAYPKVRPGTLHDDLFRRDFTVNAMALTIAPPRFGELIDPFHGVRDLQHRQLRILHNRSFLDDPSRLLRGVRFSQRFGLTWEPRTHQAAQEAIRAGALGWLNVGRLRKELEQMSHEPNPRACFEQLASLLETSWTTTVLSRQRGGSGGCGSGPRCHV